VATCGEKGVCHIETEASAGLIFPGLF